MHRKASAEHIFEKAIEDARDSIVTNFKKVALFAFIPSKTHQLKNIKVAVDEDVISVTVTIHRKHDEEDVEKIIVSSSSAKEVCDKIVDMGARYCDSKCPNGDFCLAEPMKAHQQNQQKGARA